MPFIGKLLQTLTKLRLQEGFHFAAAASGVVSFVLEVDMTAPENYVKGDPTREYENCSKCVVQYVIFPPHTKTTRDCEVDDDIEEMETTESEFELQVVTECWTEPQYGVCVNNTPECKHLDGLTASEIAKAFFPVDYECISSLVTYDHLVYLCQNKIAVPYSEECERSASNSLINGHTSPKKSPPGNESLRNDSAPQCIPFPFDLLSLLPWSQQAELLFSTFLMEVHGDVKDPIQMKATNNVLFSILLEDIGEFHDKQVSMSVEDCEKFLKLVKNRERDFTQNPLPFNFGAEDPPSTVPENFLGDEPEGVENFLTPEKPSDKECHSETISQQASLDIPDVEETNKAIPRWVCFAKASEDGNLSLTFVPASFDDLLLLNNVVLPEPVPEPEELPPEVKIQEPSLSEDNQDSLKEECTSENNVEEASEEEKDGKIAQKIPVLQRLDSEDPSSVSSSKEEEVAEWIKTNTQQTHSKSLLIPIYTYSCCQNYISDSLIQKMDYRLPQDKFEDMSFEVDECSEKYDKTSVSPRTHLSSMMESDDSQKEDDSYYSKRGMMTLDSRSRDHRRAAMNAFKLTRRNICRIFFSCYVKGVFKSLQQGLCINEHDLDNAINNICEESLPLETEITAFLHSSCSHLQHLVNRARKVMTSAKDEPDQPRRLSVRFEGLPIEDSESESDAGERIPVILQFPKTSISLSNLVALEQQCEQSPGLGLFIAEKFLEITKKWFRPVPSNPDYYYYFPEDISHIHLEDLEEEGNLTDTSDDSIEDLDQGEDEDRLIFGDMDITVRQLDEDGCSMSCSLESSNDDEEDLDRTPESVQFDDVPLFIHFTCTLKNRLEQYNVSARTLPHCISQILSLKDEDIKEFDLGNLKFTFDINCLTLPTDHENEAFNKKSLIRMLSSNSSAPSNHVDLAEADMSIVSSDQSRIKDGLGDPISHLQKKQYKSMMVFKQEIEWLLNDEIVSSLRHLSPITADTLEFVTRHIKKYKEEDRPGCDHLVINLKFVFGENKSLVPFTEEFERLKLPNYSLTKEGDYYFVILNRSHSIDMIQAMEITKALQLVAEIEEDGQDPPKIYTKIEERSNSLPTLFPLKNSADLSSSNVQEESEESDDEDEESATLRPRSKSDAKFLRRSISGLSEEVTSPTQTLNEIQQALPLFSTDTIPEPSAQPPGKLKKSCSFASFETSVVVTNSETLPSAQPQPLKSGILPTTMDRVRNRHFSAPSGPGTPQSRSSTLPQTPSWISSRGSCNEDGYDGGSSNEEQDDSHSVSDAGHNNHPLPNFWLILQIHPDKAEIFFHARDITVRDLTEEELRERCERRFLPSHIKNDIQNICKRVNQRLLLQDLSETRQCNDLLMATADEDHMWADKRTTSGRSIVDSTASEGDDDESEDGQGKRYLAARLEFMPGHFSCECVWKTLFVLHTRLKELTRRGGGASRGLMSIRTVLNKLAVINRKNMFVIKETDTQNVFYLRLRELKDVQVAATTSGNMLEDDYFVQEEPSFKDIKTMGAKSDEVKSVSKMDVDTISNFSGYSRLSSRLESVVELLVFGIEEPGHEIKDSLVRALQTKLDEAVLDVISLTLSRNPKCKLKAEDVRFIQNTEEVSKVIQLSIPPSAMMYLFALMYYLRQNLLQFLHTPNYDGNEPEDHFRDVVNGEFEAIKPENVFLFIRPPAVGKGIACISLSLADYTGSPVKLLNCPYPSVMKNCVIPTTEEFEIMTHTAQHDPFTDKSRPGPTALIQFKIWDRFNSNSEMKYLTEKLVAAVKHALCDVVLEYNLLTAPICHIPRSHDESELIQTSVPSSPVSPKGNMDRRHSVIGKRLSDSLSLKPVIQSASPLQSLKNLIPSKGRFSTPPPQSSPMFEFPEEGSVSAEIPAIQRDVSPPNSAIKEVRMMYESGQRGNLHTVYPSVLIPFTAFCSKQGTPSVNKFELSLLSEFSVDFVLKEIQSILPTIIHNLTFNLFKLVDKPGELLSGVHYFPGRSPIQPAEDNMETSLDAARKKVPVEMYSPGFLLLGRDVEQWRTVVMHENNDSDFPGTKILTNQKFQPYIFMDQDSTDALAHFRAEQDFVPRQNLVLISVQGKQITIATYNLASDLYSSLESHITKLVQWHNARAHLLDSVFSQKMGLFHHKTFSGLAYTLEQNPYTQSTFEKELLIKNLAPPRDNQRRHGSISVRDRNYTHIIDPIAQFDYIYKDQQPHVPLHKNSKIPAMKDPVYVHGVQALEIRNLSIKGEEKFNKLTELHASWMQKTSGNSSANEDHLKLLKQSSRLFHYCATPLLFSSQWRHRVVEKTNPQTKQEPSVASTPPSSDIPKSRSRHSSGASVASLKTKRSESQDGRKKATTPQDSPEVRQGSQEELWHVELRVSFSNQYISYLQNLGFKKINVQSSSKKRISKIKSSDGQVYLANDDASSGIICLQKTLTGGIILMEIGYREEFFCVKMFVFDYTQIGIGVNQQMRLLFVDECQKYKGLIHVHSFAHDFHLRCIQRYISGEDQVFHPGFHLTNFLSDFSQIYSYPPSFSRNCLQHETVVFQHSLCSSQVFEYMIKQMKDYDMKVVKMKAFCDYDVEPDYCFVKNDEFALVRTHKLTTRLADIASSIKDADDYDVGFIITKDSTQSLKQGQDSEKAFLRLKYFVLLTRRTDCFPIKNLDTRFGVRPRLNLPTESVLVEPPETERVRPVPVKRHIGVRQEMVDYLGYSNKHQTSIYNLLCMETKVCRREMEDMVEKSKDKCRQDLLWKRMLLDETEEDAKKRKKTDMDDVRDTSLVRLSYEEFQELLGMVERRPLSGEDAQLIPLSNMPLQWYQSLVPVLIAKYSSQHRSFISADGQNQCILILNANFLGMFIMLEITANKAELCCVIQDQMSDPQEHSLMSPNFSLISMQSHIEDFVNTCCFHLWSTMLL